MIFFLEQGEAGKANSLVNAIKVCPDAHVVKPRHLPDVGDVSWGRKGTAKVTQAILVLLFEIIRSQSKSSEFQKLFSLKIYIKS